jgi:hypothetical protein
LKKQKNNFGFLITRKTGSDVILTQEKSVGMIVVVIPTQEKSVELVVILLGICTTAKQILRCTQNDINPLTASFSEFFGRAGRL